MDDLSSVDKGDATEAMVIAKLKQNGEVVLQPFGDNQRYDIVIDENGDFTRVQIKTAREVNDGKVVFDTEGNHTNTKRTKKKPYSSNQIDEFIAYNHKRDDMYRVPVSEAPKSAMTLRYTSKQNSPKINWADEYII